MGQIKGWRVTTKRRDITVWQNSNSRRFLSVQRLSDFTNLQKDDKFWFVGTALPNQNGRFIRKNFKTKTAALKFARSWMKRHPRG